jgi:hypothetical protein
LSKPPQRPLDPAKVYPPAFIRDLAKKFDIRDVGMLALHLHGIVEGIEDYTVIAQDGDVPKKLVKAVGSAARLLMSTLNRKGAEYLAQGSEVDAVGRILARVIHHEKHKGQKRRGPSPDPVALGVANSLLHTWHDIAQKGAAVHKGSSSRKDGADENYSKATEFVHACLIRIFPRVSKKQLVRWREERRLLTPREWESPDRIRAVFRGK